MTRAKRLVLLQLVLWPALIVGGELGFRGWLWMRGTPYRAAEARAEMVRIVSGMTRDVPEDGATEEAGTAGAGGARVAAQLHPYVGFVPRTLPEKLQRELARYRKPIGADEVRVLILGGSVAGNFGRKGSTPLGALLERVPGLSGKRFTFVNYGIGAHKQPQQLMLACYLFSQGLQVDAVLNLDGFNEVALSAYNAEHHADPTYPSLSHWGHLTSNAQGDPAVRAFVDTVRAAQDDATDCLELATRRRLVDSALLGRWTLGRIQGHHARYTAAFEAYVDHLGERGASDAARGLAFEAERSLEIAVDTWRRSSEILAELCRARGLVYLHVLQPTLHDTGAKPVTDAERASGGADESWLRGAREGYPRLREAGAQLDARGTAFLDASGVFADVDETLYYDVCHFHTPGHLRLAHAVAARLGPLLAAQ